ncbi:MULTISPECIES: 5-histidylcysteine sulfoxide synthase [unclassified Methylophilus]|uniref:5-histidylcysteine sulfoxide synthase n=1 Tax=unclassified Methylophilus TaxID=2630143 RepID=UPI0007020D35|nr:MULTISPECIES: 5-histidylcysteine sulfoxide synthase [unclassified Methylophilus]KQT41189.1 SAM-dependent methyltransferase [Methylophilus sp. Leaf416]KQT58399.1 SAM-dependent methyltransferase [Methylophilus sp. Leaf459]
MNKQPHRSIPIHNKNTFVTREDIRSYFHETADVYEALFEVLTSDEAYYVKPNPLRHPLIFYYGHTNTFLVNKLILAGLITQRVNPQFESMFAVGVDEMGWDDVNEMNYTWPTPAEVKAYRASVRQVVDALISTLPFNLPIDWQSPWWPILMGIEHERIHLETSSVLIRQHALQYVKQHPDWAHCTLDVPAPTNSLVDIPARDIQLTKSTDYYGWDNEYGQFKAHSRAFQAAKYLTSNAEFLSFVEAGGYQKDEYWLEEGLAWRRFAQAEHPTFWVKHGDSWKLRLMTEEVDMPWSWPVEVNYHEAKAYCHWLSAQTGKPVRMPTEHEWYSLYEHAGLSDEKVAGSTNANLFLDHFASSCPVNQFAHGELFDVVGNVWQWTETPIFPFDGFQVHPLYDDFTTPTFDGRHNLIKGGSWISTGNEALKSARYAFRRHFFQHAGFRYIVTDTPIEENASHYESDKLLSEYAEFHYGDSYFGVPNFSKALSDYAVQHLQSRPAGKALDLGCATGRATFELARHFDHVTGIDFSARFIGLALKLAQQGVLRYTMITEGDLVSYQERNLAALGLNEVIEKVEFWQGDACNLKPQFTGYDFILAANLIDRLYSPRQFLSAIHERLNIGGVLMLSSPYTWLEEHTPREEWIGGYKKDGENVTTLDGLKAILGEHFTLMQPPADIPFVIRETNHKFQHTLSEVTLWERIR